MSEQTIGVIGKSSTKLASEKAELKASLLADLKGYVDEELTSLAAMAEKLIDGTLTSFSLPTGVTKVKDYLCSGSNALTSINLANCEELGKRAFEKCYYVASADFTNARITSLGEGAFSMLGSDRDRPDLNLITQDLRNSSFKFIGEHTWGGATTDHKTRYVEIFLPKTVSQIANYAFQNSEHLTIHFTGSAPQLYGANVFNGASDYELRCSWRGAYGYKNDTNWASLTTVLCSEDDDFEAGETLPAYDRDGYALTWYSDKEMTTSVATADGTSHYYCSVGSTQLASRVKIHKDNANVLIKDSSDNIYDEDHPIPYGVEVTITLSYPDGHQEYSSSINGSTLESGDTWTAASGSTLNIVALGYDGEHAPVDPILANNSPAVIREVIRKGQALTYWNIGDEINIELSSGITATFQLVDAKVGRYAFANGNGYSNAVFMAKKLYWSYQMNTSGTNAGGWPSSAMFTTRMPALLALFPEEWQNVMSEVSVPSATSNSNSALVYGDSKCFIPNTYEVYGSGSYTHSTESTDQFAIFVGTNDAAKIKKNTSDSATNWWLRSPHTYYANDFVIVGTSGSVSNGSANSTRGVALCFAI